MHWTQADRAVRMIKFLSNLSRDEASEFSQLEAADLLGMNGRRFRRYGRRFEEVGEAGPPTRYTSTQAVAPSPGGHAVAPLHALGPTEIKRIREAAHVSRPVFAPYLNKSESTVEKWETGAKRSSGMALRLLTIVEKRGLEGLS
jgi:DNA-binding transcriptional regulator YiaG